MISRLSLFRETVPNGRILQTGSAGSADYQRDEGVDAGIVFCPYHNLAMEKYLTFHVQEGQCILYLWQNRHTVVIGKNQNAWKECKVHTLEEDGGYLARRLSGGGAVYHDLGNLNFTFCVRKPDYDVSRQLEVILQAVRALGVPAIKTGRNDLTADGRKFSGNAFYESGEFCYHHGTLMMDVDKDELSCYLQVDPEKLKGKGVDSVRSRVVNLKEYCPDITADLLAGSLRTAFSDVYGLQAEELEDSFFSGEAPEEIQKDTELFSSPEWLYGRNLPFTHRLSERFEWGGVEILLQVNRGIIEDCICHTDAMDPALADRLSGCFQKHRYNKNELKKSLDRASLLFGQHRPMVLDIKALLEREL